MFTQNLNNTSAPAERILIPLEVPTSVLEHCSKLVTLKLIGGEDPGARRIREKDLVHVFANQAHARLIATLLDRQFLPIGNDDRLPSGMNLFNLTETLLFVLRNNREDFIDRFPPFGEEFGRLVR